MNLYSKIKVTLGFGLLVVFSAHANMVITPWIPIYKGVDRAAGTNSGSTPYVANGVNLTDSTLQVANCVRVDLLEPSIQLFPTPPASPYVAGSQETFAFAITNFMKNNGVQIGVDANFYNTSQGSDPTTEGIAANVEGLLITTGRVVSANVVGENRFATLMFTTNKVPVISFYNVPPGSNTAGIYTAVTGYYPILSNGVNIGAAASTSYPDSTIHQDQPRTAYGLSADRRYLYLMVIDGRQAGYSDGALDTETAFWLQQFGAVDGINMDGGGSTAMYMTDCVGNPIPLGHSSYIAGRGRERYIGAHFGIMASPLSSFISNVGAVPGSTTATITWSTDSNATSQVDYGLTSNFGTRTPLDSTPVTNHSVTLSGLLQGTKYYFRVLSVAGGTEYSSLCGGSSFTTTNVGLTFAFDLNNTWKFNTNNLDGTGWQGTNYNDSGWSNGVGCLWADSRAGTYPSPSANQIPYYFTGTRLPADSSTYPYLTYYFRTRFNFSGPVAGATLILSNYLDDGAVFYLNGAELYRANMPTGTILNSTPSSPNPCATGNATCPYVVTLSGSVLTNLVIGTNVIAVEAHNQQANSPDVTFESALFYTVQPPAQIITNVVATPGETNVTITWTTTTNATTQVLYGLTPSLGSSNAFNGSLVTSHSVTLNGLQPLTTYYFRVLSSAGGNSYSMDGSFTTVAFQLTLLDFTNSWTFTTNNLDGTNWMAPNYNDAGWLGQGPALLYFEDNPAVSPRSTPVPPGNNGLPMPTYYFRTHFPFSGSPAGFALLFTNYIDDGAVLYLNGSEIQRVRMFGGPVSYVDLSDGCPPNNCDATVDVPDVFRISGDAMTNLVNGDNVLAAEVHQHSTTSSDIVFGSTLSLVRSLVTETKLRVSRSTNVVCISWDGAGFTLQKAGALTGSNAWSDVSGPITSSPYCTTNPATTTYYRLRN